MVTSNLLNYIAAAVFFAGAIRNWFFPGVLQMARHTDDSGEAVVWFVMGGACLALALARSRQARQRATSR